MKVLILEKEVKEEESYLPCRLLVKPPLAVVVSPVIENPIAISFIPIVTFVTVCSRCYSFKMLFIRIIVL